MNEERVCWISCTIGCGAVVLITESTWEKQEQMILGMGWAPGSADNGIDYYCPKCELHILQLTLERIADQIQKQQEKIHKTETEALAAEPALTG